MDANIEYYTTICVFGFSVLLAAAMVIVERRPRKGLNPTLIPSTPILYVSLIASMLSLVHLLNLWGIHTGR
jgi:hypothetical protein